MKSEDKIMSNILNNFADKAISDEELENISGGVQVMITCKVCGIGFMGIPNKPNTCPNGHAT